MGGDPGGFSRRQREASLEYQAKRAREEEDNKKLATWTERVKDRIVQEAASAGVLSQLIMPKVERRVGALWLY